MAYLKLHSACAARDLHHEAACPDAEIKTCQPPVFVVSTLLHKILLITGVGKGLDQLGIAERSCLGRMEPLPTKATRPSLGSSERSQCVSSTQSTCFLSAAPSWVLYSRPASTYLHQGCRYTNAIAPKQICAYVACHAHRCYEHNMQRVSQRCEWCPAEATAFGIVRYLGRLLTRIWAAQVPRIVRPLAGRATVSRASMSPCMYKVKVHKLSPMRMMRQARRFACQQVV